MNMSTQDQARQVATGIPFSAWLVLGGIALVLIILGSFLAYDAMEMLLTIMGRRWWIIALVVAPIAGIAGFFAYYRHLSRKTAIAFILMAVLPVTGITVAAYYSDPAAYYDIEAAASNTYLAVQVQLYGKAEFVSMPDPQVQNISWSIHREPPFAKIQGMVNRRLASIWDAIGNLLTGNFYPDEGKANMAFWVQTPNGWVLAQTGTAPVRTDLTTTATAVFKIPEQPVTVVGITIYKERKNMWGSIPKTTGLDGSAYRLGEEIAYREIVVQV